MPISGQHLLRRHHVAGDEVLVGVAQAGGLPLDEHLAGLGRVELDLLDLPVLVRHPDAAPRLRLHVVPSFVVAASDPTQRLSS